MTYIASNAPITIPRPKLPSFAFPRLGIGALLAAIPGSLGDAFEMAYVAPYAGHQRLPEAAPDEALEGRDPNW